MAKLNLDYYVPSNDDFYTDGDIEQELLEYSKDTDYDWYQDGRWPIVYHLSHLRHNILNWFPFKQECNILEIGAGCGALTGLLCDRSTSVVAVELTKRRAEVNFQRHKHKDNLEIVVCDFQSIPTDWKFDYVIINGVLEYASYMIEGDYPYKEFLEVSKKHLKDHGKILLAIENRLGLKYFSGAKEDHTGKYFSGINGYIEGEKVRTFSKEELCEQINAANLHVLKFYYPYPDYKFPAEIFTDSTVNKLIPSVSDYPMDMIRTKLFEEKTIYQSLMKLNVMDKFSNSFLVEIASNVDEEAADVSYVKLSANRKAKLRIGTYINEGMNRVFKKALSPQAESHLNDMKRFGGFDYFNDGKIRNIYCKDEQKGLSYSFINERSLEETLLEAYSKADLRGFITAFEDFRDILYNNSSLQKQTYCEKFEELFGNSRCQQELRWTTNTNIDMISSNVFVKDNTYQIIDYEWHFDCKIPQEFVVWRMLKQLMANHSLGDFLTKSMVYSLININEETENCFYNWEEHFANEYVGIKNLYSLSKDIIPIDIETAASRTLKENRLVSSLFFDIGGGYTEANYESKYATPSSDGFSVIFTIDKLRESRALRWDPLEGSSCSIKIHHIETDGIISSITAINAEKYTEEQGYKFFTFDPQIELVGDFKKASFIKINFSCEILDWTEGYLKQEEKLIFARQQLETENSNNKQLSIEINRLKELIHEFEYKVEIILKDSELTKNSLLSAQGELQSTQEKLLESQDKLLETQKKLLETQDELIETQDYIHHVSIQAKEHKFKTIKNVLLYGDITRGTINE